MKGCFLSFIKSILRNTDIYQMLDIVNSIFLNPVRMRILTIHIAYSQMTYAFPFAHNAEAGKDMLAFVGLKLLTGAMYPATADPQSVGSNHHIAHHKAAVIYMVRLILVSQHYQHLRRTIEGVKIFVIVAYLTVHLTNAVAHLRVVNSNDDGVLPILTAGSL